VSLKGVKNEYFLDIMFFNIRLKKFLSLGEGWEDVRNEKNENFGWFKNAKIG